MAFALQSSPECRELRGPDCLGFARPCQAAAAVHRHADRLCWTQSTREPPMIGERLGKWVIFKELGRGGMGRVYLAQEEITGQQAAIKVLAAELAVEVGFLERFKREIETLSQLTHPNIVRFYESGFENGIYYYAMEYV